MKVNNKKGFTLAELLIVVAIIGVLIAIAMPTFGKQLESARAAADEANLRAAYGEAVADFLANNGFSDDMKNNGINNGTATFSVDVTGTDADTIKVTFKTGQQSTTYAGSSYYDKTGAHSAS